MRPGQAPPLLRIHLRSLRHRTFCLLRVGYPLALLSADTRHGDHQLLCSLSHQYTAFHQREPGPQALERHLGIHSLNLRPQWILRILPALLRKPSSRGLWFSHRLLRAIQIVEPSHFILSFILTLKLCDSSRTFGIHFGLLQRYHLKHLMTHSEFFYPRVAMEFYQSMTTHGAQSPITIYFSIDRR